MAYKVIILYRLYMPSYVLGTFTEYPYTGLSVFPDRPFLFISICPQLSPSAHRDR